MEAKIHLGRFQGIPIGLHWSWFLIFAFITWSLVGMFTFMINPPLPRGTAWVAAGITSLLFFASILLHEMAHAVVARRNHIPVRSINLFLLGGVAQIGQEPETAGAEFRIAAAGPAASLALAGLFGAASLVLAGMPGLREIFTWLGRINLLLAGFNLIPGFPLDGGRIFRAILWHFTGSVSKATRYASTSGQIVAFCFIAYGILTVFKGSFLSGIWMAFIGWYLNSAAVNSRIPDLDNPVLEHISIAQVIKPGAQSIPASMSLHEVITGIFVPKGIDIFTVTENEQPVGILSIQNAAAVPREDWLKTSAGQVMLPLDKAARIPVDTTIGRVLQTMDQRNLAHVTLMDGDVFSGVLSREQINRYIHLLTDLGMRDGKSLT